MSDKTRKYKKLLKTLDEKIKVKTDLCYIGANPTRVKIILLLKMNDELCTSGLADILGLSASAISHQKVILEKEGIIESRRSGRDISCRLLDRKKSKELLRDII